MKHTITFEDLIVKNIELADEQVEQITKELENNKVVPLYSTTCASKKYGKCLVGNIISIK